MKKILFISLVFSIVSCFVSCGSDSDDENITIPKYGGTCYIDGIYYKLNNGDKTAAVTKSPKDKYNGGMWEPTGGLAISGETSIQAIKSELYEEIGLEIKENTLELIDSHRDDRFFRDIYLIKADLKLENIKFNDREVINAKFVTIDEFKDMIKNNEINSWNESFIQIYEKEVN